MNEISFQNLLEKKFLFTHGIGIGDDAAFIENKDPNPLVITKDILIENIHFKMAYFTLEELAQKAVAVNLSDIAAMGGLPEYFFLGLGLPKKYQNKITIFFKGIKKSCETYNIELAGGDFSISDQIFISITMIGKKSVPILRKSAEIDDYICISKNPGESALGLKILQNYKKKVLNKDELYFVNKHKEVIPEIIKGQIISKYANSMLDISDGLVKDLNRILTASKKGAEIIYEKIPISNNFTSICSKYDVDNEELVLSGGEDYALLFTVSNDNLIKLKKEKISFSIIGKIVEDEGLIIKKDNKALKNNFSGFDHFLI